MAIVETSEPVAALEEAPTLADVGDLLHERWLDDVPPGRILMRPFPGTATEADLVRDHRGPRERACELVAGVLVEKAMGLWESMVASVLIQAIRNYLDAHTVDGHPLGWVGGEQGGMKLGDKDILMPDVSYIRYDRLPKEQSAYPAVAPDLAVEVVSPTNSRRELAGKRRRYFAAGTSLIWEIVPGERQARIYSNPRQPDECLTIGVEGVLEGSPVLPGFQVVLGDLLAKTPFGRQ